MSVQFVSSNPPKRRVRASMCSMWAAVALLAAGCAGGPTPEGELIADPYVETNRSIHAFNKGVDTAIVRPVSQAYGFVTPALFQHMIGNGLQHLRLPGIFINRVLQGDVEEAGAVFGRFGLNTLMGAGGLLDPATEFGLPYEPSDFGVTLAEWGAKEGVYLEAPLLGPNTTRHLVGRIVGLALDPTFLITVGAVDVTGAVEAIDTARTPLNVVNTRYQNRQLLDDILYESEDSYITARTGYVQNRRLLVSGGTSEDRLPNIFGD